ncbi:hypothetical protein Q7C36_007473 [Tachysurus vachellii]|uniref:Uncharacterized protein n=1 Tax=Tachysurus vachellii TaxID=175792 RepID=A0AA88T330_TACVA|nr:hypothetical protein Q7C36_007473 [Tachysurus vachellii]
MTETFGHREKHMDQMNTSLVQREISSGTPILITMKDEFTTAPSRKSFTQEYILKQRQGIGNDEKPYPYILQIPQRLQIKGCNSRSISTAPLIVTVAAQRLQTTINLERNEDVLPEVALQRFLGVYMKF